MGWKPLPNDGNYGSWEPLLRKSLEDACGNNREFHIATDVLGRFLFNGVSSSKYALKLAQALDGSIPFGKYIGSKSGQIVALIFGCIGVVFCVFAAFSLKRNFCCSSFLFRFSKCIGRGGVNNDSKKSPVSAATFASGQEGSDELLPQRLKKKKPYIQPLTIMFNGFFGALSLVFGIFLLLSSVQIIKGTNDASCAMWMQLYGHYFGASQFGNSQTTAIPLAWGGTHNQYSLLSDLIPQVTPGESNGVREECIRGYLELRETALSFASETETNITDAWKRVKWYYDLQWTALNANKDIKNKARWISPLNILLEVKRNKFLDEMWTTLDWGFGNITNLIDEFTNDDAVLVNTAYNATTDALGIIGDLNGVVGKLTETWYHLSKLLRGLLLLVASFEILIFGTSIAGFGASTYLAIRLINFAKNDQLPPKLDRKLWGALFLGICIVCGLSSLLAPLSYLTASIGWDACHSVNTTLIEQNDWNMLGQSILNPFESMRADIPLMLDTCIGRQGSGSVAQVSGLDKRIVNVAAQVESAKKQVINTREALLDRTSKLTQAKTLGVGFKDNFHYQGRRTGLDDPTIVLSKYDNSTYDPELHFLRPEVDWNYDVHKSWDLPCFLPNLGNKTTSLFPPTILACMTSIIDFYYPSNYVIDRLNTNYGDAIRSTVSEFPKFCHWTLKNTNHTCAADETAVELNSEVTTDDISSWAEMANSHEEGLGDKLKPSLNNIIWQAKFLQMPLSALKEANPELDQEIECPNGGGSSCVLNDIRIAYADFYKSFASDLVTAVSEIFRMVDDYTENVVLKQMDDLLDLANRALENSNCQYDGLVISEVVLDNLCHVVMPAMTLSALIFMILFLIMIPSGYLVLRVFSYLNSLSANYDNSPELYKLDDVSFTPMSAREEFQVLYSGDHRKHHQFTGGVKREQTRPHSASSTAAALYGEEDIAIKQE